MTFSNPRLTAVFDDWPLGGSRRGSCTFRVEHDPKRGYRFVRQTFGAPKKATYGGPAVIVDGSNGKTYLLQFTSHYTDFIKVSAHDFKDAPRAELDHEAAVFPTAPQYQELAALIRSAYVSEVTA